MYERFCNGMHYLCNPFLCAEKIESNRKNYGYSLFKNEKPLNYKEALGGEDTLLYKLFDRLNKKDNGLLEDYFKTIYNNEFFGVPFKGVNINKTLYMDPRLLQRYHGSSGMAAGNTFNEALNQGLSEIFEHYVLSNFYIDIDNKDFYFYDTDSIKDEKLKNIISTIESHNNNFYIIDMSRTYNVPVMVAILINKYSGTVAINFGAFPVFEIAVERVCTEMYQNCFSFDTRKTSVISPYYSLNKEDMVMDGGSCITNLNTFPESLFLNKKFVDTVNKDVFLSYTDKSYSNDEILEHNKKIATDIGADIYCADMSLIDGITAISIYVDNLNGLWKSFFDRCQEVKETGEAISITKNKHLAIKNYLKNKDKVYDVIKYCLDYYNITFDKIVDRFCGLLTHGDQLVAYNNKNVLLTPNEMFVKNLYVDATGYLLENQGFSLDISVSCFYPYYKKYLTLLAYVHSRKYSKEDMIKIFKEFDYIFTDEDFKHITNRKYLVEKCILEPMYNIFRSKDFKEMIKNY